MSIDISAIEFREASGLRAAVRPVRRWHVRYVRELFVLDAVAALVAGILASVLRFGLEAEQRFDLGPAVLPYPLVVALLPPLWLVLLGLHGCYERRVLGSGAEEYRRVVRTALVFGAAAATAAYLFRSDIARGFLLLKLPLLVACTLTVRRLARRHLARHRTRGERQDDVLVVGTPDHVRHLVRRLRAVPTAGYRVLGAVLDDDSLSLDVDGEPVPVLGRADRMDEVLANTQADALAVADTAVLAPEQLRRLAWQLEGTGVDLVVAPGLTDVAGPRISIYPVAGLPLLYVDEPQLGGAARLFKDTCDRVGAFVALIVLAPVLGAIALAVRLTSPGPALFRQVRVGRHGDTFTIYKFRTMRCTAEQELAYLLERNEHDGPLFKIREDPRRTPVGRVLRRFSLDELPQLWNVLNGHMSLVGPRPPLPGEVERYADHVQRRLLVKPGLTGLWQVNGRADLPWEESVRLDLYYVENWSPTMDALILWKTAWAVLGGRGAY